MFLFIQFVRRDRWKYTYSLLDVMIILAVFMTKNKWLNFFQAVCLWLNAVGAGRIDVFQTYHKLRFIFMHANHIHLIKIWKRNQPWLWFFILRSTLLQIVKISRFLFVCLSFPWWCVQGALYEFHFMSISCHFLSEISQMSEALTPHCLVYFRCPSSPHFYRRWLCRWPDLNYKTETHEISLL